METHIADQNDGIRPLAKCGVRVDASQIVKTKPSCSWCARKQEEAARARAARAASGTYADDDLPF